MNVERFISEVTRPLFIFRMARGDGHAGRPTRVKSATTRRVNAEREIERLIAEYSNTAAYDGSNEKQRRELTARERDIVCRVLTDVIAVARHGGNFDCVSIRVGETEFINVLREVRGVLDPRES
jgi:hypothetical protein